MTRTSLHGLPLLVALGVLAPPGCSPDTDEMPADVPCKNVAYSIASRTLACEGDADLANERGDRFRDGYTCVVVDPDAGAEAAYAAPFACAAGIGALGCETVERCGDDLDCWLTAVSSCVTCVVRLDGRPLEQADAGG